MTTTVQIPLSIDATVAENVTAPAGLAQFLSVYTGSGDARRIFASGVRSFPLGARIISAKLRATQQAVAASASRTLRVRPVASSWKESTVTWANQPGTSDVAEAEITLTGAGSVGRVAEWDVTAMTQRFADGLPFFGFRIHSLSTSLIRFFSQESGRGLVWEVTYSTAPAAPGRLSPSSGRAVSIARPTLSAAATIGTTAGMTGYRVQLFSGDPAALSSAVMSELFASFNINGITSAPTPFTSRLNGIGSTIVSSNAKVIGLQEVSTDSVDQPTLLTNKVKELSGRTTWTMFVGPNLNAILVDTSVFTPLWPTTKNKSLGDGKWAVAMQLQHIATGTIFTYWTTHFLAGAENEAKRAAAARVLIPWLATLGPSIGGGDLNNYSAATGKPLSLLGLAGYLDVRTLVDREAIVNVGYNSSDGYGANGMQGRWIDHHFVSGGPAPTAVGLVDSGSAADHNLVYAAVEYAENRVAVAGVGEPSFDTGDRAGTSPQWTIERDVAVGEVIGHRWQIIYGTERSDWSDVAFFTRVPKPALTILSPGEAPDDFVSESTPPFIVDFDGTQTAYRVRVTDPVDRTIVLWDSGRQGGSDATVTPSIPLGLVAGSRYLLIWESEDDVEREATAGDPIAAVAEREFGFELSASVDPVTALNATQADERPWARIDFTSSTAPDAIEVLRDGVSLGVFAPGDLIVSGSSYAYIDRRVSPQTEHVWEVRRIVNGVTSQDNPTALFTVRAEGVWLCSEDGEHAVLFDGEAEDASVVGWSADEDVELQRPLGGRVAQPVTHGIFGRTGDLSGTVIPWSGQTYAESRAAVEALRPPLTPYGTPMILSRSDECVRVFWVGVVAGPRDEFGHARFPVSAELHEVPDGVA